MHPETKKITHKKTCKLTENLKLQLSPGLVASYDIQPGNGVGLFWDKHTRVYSLTYLPRTHTGPYIGLRTQLLRRLCRLGTVLSYMHDSSANISGTKRDTDKVQREKT